MTTNVCFTTGPTCGIGAEIAKAPLVDSNQVAATGRKPAAVRRSSGSTDNLLPVTLDVTRKEQAERAAVLPIIAVVFTVGGPVVYGRTSKQFA